MSSLRDIQLKRDQTLSGKEDARSIFVAKLVSVNGSVSPNNRPNYVYFQEYGSDDTPLGVAWNVSVKPLDQLPVLIGSNPNNNFRLEVISIYIGDLTPDLSIDVGSYSTPPHHTSHEFQTETEYGSDVVRVFPPAIQVLKTSYSGLTVTVQPYIYSYLQVRYAFAGGTFNLTPSAASKHRYTLIYLDVGSNTIQALDGTEISTGSAVSPPLPSMPDRAIASAYLLVDDTEITENLDARDFLNKSKMPIPDEDGDILIGVGGVYQSGKPLVDRLGEILTDSNGVIITV